MCLNTAAVGTSIGRMRTKCGMPPRATTNCVVWSPTKTVATVASGGASRAVARASPNAVRSTPVARSFTRSSVAMICSIVSATAATRSSAHLVAFLGERVEIEHGLTRGHRQQVLNLVRESRAEQVGAHRLRRVFTHENAAAGDAQHDILALEMGTRPQLPKRDRDGARVEHFGVFRGVSRERHLTVRHELRRAGKRHFSRPDAFLRHFQTDDRSRHEFPFYAPL